MLLLSSFIGWQAILIFDWHSGEKYKKKKSGFRPTFNPILRLSSYY